MYYCYTDGGCRVSERTPGGWGVFIRPPKGDSIEKFGGSLDTDSTTMELTAVKEALILLPAGVAATIFSDSQEIITYCNKSIPIWQQNGWKNTPELLQGLLNEISALITEKQLKITWAWVKSHNGNAGNERADQLADQGARDVKKTIKSAKK